MNAIQFFNDLGKDILAANSDTGRDPELQSLRVHSIALRVLGSAAALCALGLLIAGTASPIPALFTLILAYDLMRVGSNMSQITPPLKTSFIQAVLLGAQTLKASAREIWRDTPFSLHDTVLLEPAYKLALYIQRKIVS